MTIETDYDAVRHRIAAARAALETTDEPQWTPERRAGWNEALDAIGAYLAGMTVVRSFSIVRTLDMTAGTEGPVSAAILEVAAELRRSGIDRYR